MTDAAPPEPADASDLADLPIDDLRALRTVCVDDETGLSYLRRMVQGPLDIVRGEITRRDAGGGSDLAGLVGDLPSLLADGTRAGDGGRLPHGLEPTRIDPGLQAELSSLLGEADIASVTELDDDQLAEVARDLAAFERKVSERRRALHRLIDAYQAELTRRYRTGEASVESLLD
jgi:hypothetical protein